jgi:UDP-N-acetylglucosamine 2-epimerase (non-hydrolysing)
MHILLIVGTRPNFIKITQFPKVIERYPELNLKILHTGQHHDENMSRIFFRQFGFEPDHFLKLSATSANSQMGEIMIGIEAYANKLKPDLMIVVGDVNSTLAAAITANKLGIPLAHLESGLRSGDRSMPEEINRILTDQITDYFFVTEESGLNHIKTEHLFGRAHFVGNTMIDTLVAFKDEIDGHGILNELSLQQKDYALMTMHRPATVDNKAGLTKLLAIIRSITLNKLLVFPIHPRTTKNLQQFDLWDEFQSIKNLKFTEPLDYFAFQKLIAESAFLITDSGGIQEETTFRGVPCLTLRPNTERPSTTTVGTNSLVEFDEQTISAYVQQIENGSYKRGQIPPLWDGQTTERIMKIISEF